MKIQTGTPLQSMMSRFSQDPLLLCISLAILLFGFVMMTSASLHLGARAPISDSFHYPFRQLLHIGIGIIAAGVVVSVDMEFWERSGPWLFVFGLLLLVMVLIPGLGVKVNGSYRWLSVAGFRIQVSEIVKFFSVIYMAGYVTRHGEMLRKTTYGLFRPLLLLSFACLLMLLEPDFGSAVVVLIIALGVMFLSGARLWQFFLLLALVTLLALALVYFSPYRWARVTAFIDPWVDPLKTGFQLVQALISFGRGEWLGVGLGAGIQKLFYLPEAHTDFLFSVIAEELGLLGVLTTIGLYSLLLWRAFVIGSEAERMDRQFSAYVAYGLAIWFGFQSFVNMGVNMGVLPTKGLTLPLMSYGGGSMITMCCALALLFRIHSETLALQRPVAKQGKVRWASTS